MSDYTQRSNDPNLRGSNTNPVAGTYGNTPGTVGSQGGNTNPDTRGFNHPGSRDNTHGGFGGSNPSNESYERDLERERGRSNLGASSATGVGSGRADPNVRSSGLGNTSTAGMGNNAGMGTTEHHQGIGTGTHHSTASSTLNPTTHHQYGEGRTTAQYDPSLTAGGGGMTGGANTYQTTQTGMHSGDGIHAQQYGGREHAPVGTGTTTTVPGTMGTGIHHHHAHEHGGGGEGLKEGCEACRAAGTHHAQHHQSPATGGSRAGQTGLGKWETTDTQTREGASNLNLRPGENVAEKETRVYEGGPAGQTKMTSTGTAGTKEGTSHLNLRPGEKIKEQETKVHHAGVTSGDSPRTGAHPTTGMGGTGSGTTGTGHTGIGSKTGLGTGGAGTGATRAGTGATTGIGPTTGAGPGTTTHGTTGAGAPGTGQHGAGMQHGKPTMADKIIGGAEKAAGKMTANPELASRGAERAAGDHQ